MKKKIFSLIGIALIAVALFAVHCFGLERVANNVWDLTDSQLTVIIIGWLLSGAAAICGLVYLVYQLIKYSVFNYS